MVDRKADRALKSPAVWWERRVQEGAGKDNQLWPTETRSDGRIQNHRLCLVF